MSDRIEISQPYVNDSEAIANVTEAITSRRLAQGIQVQIAETALKSVFNSEHAALLSNGTASLRAALIASVAAKQDIPIEHIDRYMNGKEVIIPAFSFNATINTVLQTGATARVVDISESDYLIDSELAEQALTADTVAIMPVDLYGQPSLVSNANGEFGDIAVVRDSAQAHGAQIDGLALTRFADAASLSFYPTKNVAAPEGGAVVTDNARIDEIIRVYRNQGMRQRYEYAMIGDNLRMSDVHAAILRANIGSLAVMNTRRALNAKLMSEGLTGVDGITIPLADDRRTHVWHQYTILIEKDFAISRGELAQQLDRRGIGSGIYYPKIMTDYPAFEGHPRVVSEHVPKARDIANRVLSLPIHHGLNDSDIERVVEAISDIQKGKNHA